MKIHKVTNIEQFAAKIIPKQAQKNKTIVETCLLYTSPSPRDAHESRMPSSA